MKSYFIDTPPILNPFFHRFNWAKTRYGIEGATAVGFIGPENHFDPNGTEKSSAAYVLHLIIELPHTGYSEMILWQHLLADHLVQALGPHFKRKNNAIFQNGQSCSKSFTFWNSQSAIFYLGIFMGDKAHEPVRSLWIKNNAITALQAFCEEYQSVEATKIQEGLLLQ